MSADNDNANHYPNWELGQGVSRQGVSPFRDISRPFSPYPLAPAGARMGHATVPDL